VFGHCGIDLWLLEMNLHKMGIEHARGLADVALATQLSETA